MNQSRFLAALLLLISLVLAGCSDSGSIDNPNETQRIGPSGGTFNYHGGQVRLVVPAGSLSSDTDVTVRTAAGYPADSRLLSGTAWNISTANGSSFSTANKATLRIRWGEVPLGVNVLLLKIFRLNGGVWEQMETIIDTTGQAARADITAPGTYAIFTTGSLSEPQIFKTVLGPSQVIGNVTSTASGTARVEVSSDQNTVQVQLQTTGMNLAQVTSAHIHLGRIGETNTQPAATLFNQSSGAFTDDFTDTFTAADINTNVVANMNVLIEAIRSGNAYVDIHTTTNTQGELRGQLGLAVELEAELTGAQETPEVTTTATGNATVTFNQDMSQITVQLNTTGLTNAQVTAAHIHVGARNVPGLVIFPLYAQGQGTFNISMTFTLDQSDFTAAGDVDTYNEAVAAILGGQTYINVHTVANPNGEIRGQIEPPLL
jgi:hypothetical protein